MACSLKYVCVLVMCMAVMTAPLAKAAITCDQMRTDLTPCYGFIAGAAAIPSACCDGIRSLAAAARTTSDRRAVCKCLKDAAASYPGIDPDRAGSLPGKCGVKVAVNVPNGDCNKIN